MSKIFISLVIFVDMIIVNIDNKGNLDKALKTLKSKVIQTRQNEQLRLRKEYEKKSVKLRNQKLKAIYKQSLISSH
jgi:small subunit ribosomal protein S21